MVYKVSEVVKELGVSRQTVYKKLRRNKAQEPKGLINKLKNIFKR